MQTPVDVQIIAIEAENQIQVLYIKEWRTDLILKYKTMLI